MHIIAAVLLLNCCPVLLADDGQVRVYTKKVGHKPDFGEPVVLTADR
jgi:ribosome-interacting GTPase 1